MRNYIYPIINYSQEDVEQDEKHKEYVGEEVDGPKYPVSLFDDNKIEVTKDCTEQCVAGARHILQRYNEPDLKYSTIFTILL